jgi:hypothetical protein
MRIWDASPLTRRRLAWAAVLAANLPIPILFGMGCTEGPSRVGMFAGVGLIWLLGHVACRTNPRAALPVMYGGWIVAASQFWPAAQMMAGMIGLWAASFGTPTQDDRLPEASGALAGFTATIVTGGLLLAVAAILGLGIWALFSSGSAHPDKPKVRLDELA